MSYTVQSSERTKSKGSEFETKALLYLMNFRSDSDDIHYFVVDFFNDLTGTCRFSDQMWDLQSKAAKNNFQADIGKEMVTLFKNYVSDFEFQSYILFVGGIADTIRIDNTVNIFGIENINVNSLKKIKNALMKECKKKSYIDNSKITDENLDSFLDKVLIVIDDKDKIDYVKGIIKVNSSIIPSNIILEQIFNEIRDAQSSKKNNNNVEGVILNVKQDFLYYNRHLTSQEIRMMALNTFVNNDLMQKGITPSFMNVYNKIPQTEQKNTLEDCKLALAKTLFDKNNNDSFWDVFSDMYNTIMKNPTKEIDVLFKMLDKKILNKLNYLDIMSAQYFLAIIKDGIYDN